jgi:thiamine-phosphate pyrophosphorylase
MGNVHGSLTARLAVYLVADPEQTKRPFLDDVEAALNSGVTAVQLRAKRAHDRDLFALAMKVRELSSKFGAMFIVNDRFDISLAARADGVHLGVDDLPVATVRALAPAGFVIGYSPETDEQAAGSRPNGADYVGVGPVFGTNSKSDAGVPIGLEMLKRRIEIAGIPVVGIGGVSWENAASVIEAGAVGVAVVSAILAAPDPAGASRRLVEAVQIARTTAPSRARR